VTRVLLIHQPTDGGVGRHVRDLANGLGARGHDVVLCGPSPLPDTINATDHRRLDLRRAIAPREDLAAVLGLARLVRQLRPAVVHAHSSKAGAVARLARLLQPRVPVVYTPHGYAFAGHFDSTAERQAYRAIEYALAPLASRVVCVCEAEARLARSIGPSARVRVVNNGVGPPHDGPIDPRVRELAERGPVVGALTQARPGKGLETLIDAAPEVLERHPGAQLAIVGEGPDLVALRSRARKLEVSDRVHFLGSSTDPLGVLRGFDVFSHPSWAESFPYVVLEAMSVRRPIVASDVGGIAEAVIDRDSALLVPPRDAPALAHAVSSLLEDPVRGECMGERALQRVNERFTLTQMIERLAETYDELIGEDSSSSPTQAQRNGIR
jgi:glycosyltransferase involved in cell wall biosynthesis